jgi:hypothetical protein
MVIPHTLIPSLSNWRYDYAFKEVRFILIIINLHLQKVINDKKLAAMLKSLRDKKLDRRIRTYHCKITDSWYNDKDMSEILLTAYYKKCTPKDIDIETFLKYLNKYTNLNRNFNINWIYINLVKPCIENEWLETFNSLKIPNAHTISYEEADRKYDLDSGYCCSDCDGCRGEYKRSRYRYHYAMNSTDIKKKVKEYFFSIKTEAKYHNPIEMMKSTSRY